MANQSQSSNLIDPLRSHYGLSMFPRTIGDSTMANDLDQIESIHNYMKSMALRSPNKLLDQAKIIVHNSELLQSDLASFVTAENKDEAIAARSKDNPQERRPALGRKRARFSLKPNSSQPSLSLESCLDITQLQDPEGYFLAYEKLDNAKKELERQKGCVGTDLNEYRPSKTARPRRPGILGKSVSYKHHQYSSVLSKTEEVSVFSQEPLEQDILSPNYVIRPETACPNVESHERELAGSVTKTEKRVNVLLDELLSSNCENLDEDAALSFLQEALHIKPICLNKLCLPDLHDIGGNNFKPLAEKSPKPQKTLSDTQNLVIDKSVRTSVIHKLMAEVPLNLLASPSPPKSPFTSLTLLRKRILQSNQSGNLLSDFNLDLSPTRNPSADNVNEQSDHVDPKEDLMVAGSKSLPIELLKPVAKNPLNPLPSPARPESPFASASLPRKQILQSNLSNDAFSSLNMDPSPVRNIPSDNANEQSCHVCSTKELAVFEKLKSRTIEKDDVTVAKMGTLEWIAGDPVLFDKSAKENSRRVSIDIDVGSSGFDNNLECNNRGSNIDGRLKDDDINLPITDAHRNESHEMQEKIQVEDMPSKAIPSVQPDINVESSAGPLTDTRFQPYGHSEMEKNAGDTVHEGVSSLEPDINAEGSTMENLNSTVHKGVSSLVPDNNIEGSTMENLYSTQSELDRTGPAAVEQHAMDDLPDVGPEKHIEEPSGISSNEQLKEKIPQCNGRKRKAFYHRQSLAAAGTCWESGVRRSSRIRMRPLEYWKGERFLYGRIHKSMTTVIGVKYVSPGKGDGKHNMRVKSYISDEYKELVELAALH